MRVSKKFSRRYIDRFFIKTSGTFWAVILEPQYAAAEIYEKNRLELILDIQA
jgi:hypothetical protein